MPFYDRRDELDALETAFDSAGTRVLRRLWVTSDRKDPRKFCAGRSHVYYVASQEAEQRRREKLVEQGAEHFGDRVPHIDGWDNAFDYLGEKLVVVIDEFPYRRGERLDSLVRAVVRRRATTGHRIDAHPLWLERLYHWV